MAYNDPGKPPQVTIEEKPTSGISDELRLAPSERIALRAWRWNRIQNPGEPSSQFFRHRPLSGVTMQRSKSQAAFERAKQLMPGGVNSPARAFGGRRRRAAVHRSRPKGPYLFDIDGNRYIDYIGSWGPMILGHGHPKVVEALETAIRRGTSFGAPTEAESELAELIIDAVPSIEKVRLVNSGTEATMSAIRARPRLHRPRRDRQVRRQLPRPRRQPAGRRRQFRATLGVPNSPGVTAGTAQGHAGRSAYNDVEGLAGRPSPRMVDDRGVIFEPVVGNMGCVVPSPEFRRLSASSTTQHGALLIFDEVMTGFRVAYGGRRPCSASNPI